MRVPSSPSGTTKVANRNTSAGARDHANWAVPTCFARASDGASSAM